MRTFSLYDPKVYSLLLFRPKKDKTKQLLEMLKSEFMKFKGIKCDLSNKDEWTIIELMLDILPDVKGLAEVSPDLIKVKYEEISGYRKTINEKLLSFIETGSSVQHYTLFTCASNEKVWMKTYSDISFLYKDRDEDQLDVLQSNISYLNRIMNRSGEIIINTIQHGKVSSSLYLLGSQQGRMKEGSFRDMVLEMDMGDIRAISTYGESPIQVTTSSPYGEGTMSDKKLYQIKQTYLINLMAIKSKIIEMFLVQSQFAEMGSTELKDLFIKGRDLKDQIFQLQNSINNHMQVYSTKVSSKGDRKKKKEKAFLKRESFETEKELLTRASVRFSLVSEVEHQIMRSSSRLQDLHQRISEVTRSISMSTETVSIEGLSHTLGGMTQKRIDSARRDLSTLLDELSHSRDILSSTIEVLRTFIDTRQREVSEEMSRLMNVLFLVFACIGLADALGNFVILAIEYMFLEDATRIEVLRWSSFGLMLTLLPLLIAVMFLVLYFNKKK
ncbi:MAG: hypothetical protein ACMUHY_01180 [Thermoplasmatota archaeon]